MDNRYRAVMIAVTIRAVNERLRSFTVARQGPH